MPNFKYRVRDRSGKAMAETMDAPNLQMAGDRLFQLGYFPIKIVEEGEKVPFDLSNLQTLAITSSTIDNLIPSQSIEEIGKKLREGSSLTDAIRER